MRPSRAGAWLFGWLAILVVTTGCGGGPGPMTETAAGPGSAASSAGPSGDPRLPEGTYSTPELTRDQLLAAGQEHGVARSVAAQALVLDGIHQTATFTLKLENGQWTEFYSYDGGAQGTGFRATYKVIDGNTAVTTEECCGESTFHYELDGDSIRFLPGPELDAKCLATPNARSE